MPRGIFTLGTRPEAIKLAPVVLELRSRPGWEVTVCATGQHGDMFDRVLDVFGIQPDWNLSALVPGSSLTATSARILTGLDRVITDFQPDALFVQGDTISTVCGALAAFYARVPAVVHVEAGLRTGSYAEPFPEEMNRVLTSRLGTVHCAATQPAVDNLVKEGIDPGTIVLTGNTVVDALHHTVRVLRSGAVQARPVLPPECLEKRLILATAHRRENLGEPLRGICRALRMLAEVENVAVVFPVHPNPSVRAVVDEELAGSRVYRTDPLDYPEFVDLLSRAYLTITDSGGVQEEAPSLGKPVLVMRNRTERPESVAEGVSKLVGTDPNRIVSEALQLLHDASAYAAMARVSTVYGDGKAAPRVAAATEAYLRALLT